MRRLSLLWGLLVCWAHAQTYQPLLNHERMTQLFMQMARIDSGSENEAEMCAFVAEQLRALGAEVVVVDEASKQIGGTGGNVFARFRGTVEAPPLLLNAHVDTVQPTAGIQLVRDANEIRTDGRTILGADNKAGVAIILEVLRTLKERNLPHPPLEVVFTIREEKGLQGAKVFDTRQLRARTGLVIDGGENPQVLYIGSPTHWKFEVVFYGKAAHAGAEPEKGRNAIAMAARAIAQMNWGRLDADTTANVGVIEGGQAMNIVPERVRLVGEFRSFDPQRVQTLAERWKALCEQVAREMEGKVEVNLSQTFGAVRLPPDAPIVQAAVEGLRAIGLEAKLERTGGGTDANAFALKGIQCLVFPTGADRIHSTEERLILRNFYLCGEGVLQTILHWAKRAAQPMPATTTPSAIP